MSIESGASACGSMEDIDMWYEAESWGQLIQLNRNFLRGETNCTPYYAAPLDDETVPTATDLLKMHDFDCCIKSPKLRSNFPAEWETHMQAYASTRAKLLKQELKPYTHIDLSCNSILFCFRQNELMAAMRPLVVNVLAKGWEDINIAKLVADIAEKSGLESVYLDNTAGMKDGDDEEKESQVVDDDGIDKK
ncbi:hypothetical protein Slin15195_G005030 [Septoria linicola]|uniref:Uncharacterized protein n=1 Tax=Septoria linicola TaxID=215465 RepID=A0A9Q9AGJ1_9PEZI|nr:hypothetical protein Slin14017_G005070 [Septoria linicola]USW47184.1 hypothetical protein Slin15195_G005030 [Septoria linicola]